VSLLGQLGLIEGVSYGNYYDGKTFETSLNDRGKKLAHAIALREIESNKDYIKGIVEKYGYVISFMASLARKLFAWEECSYQKAVEELGVSDYDVSGWSGYIHPVSAVLLANVAKYLPKVRELYASFIGEFKNVKLSFESKEALALVPELSDFVVKEVKTNALDKLGNILKEFSALPVLYNLAVRSYKGVKMNEVYHEELVRVLEVNETKLSALVDELRAKGVTSKLMKKKPFIVILDWDTFVKTLGEKLAQIERRVIGL